MSTLKGRLIRIHGLLGLSPRRVSLAMRYHTTNRQRKLLNSDRRISVARYIIYKPQARWLTMQNDPSVETLNTIESDNIVGFRLRCTFFVPNMAEGLQLKTWTLRLRVKASAFPIKDRVSKASSRAYVSWIMAILSVKKSNSLREIL